MNLRDKMGDEGKSFCNGEGYICAGCGFGIRASEIGTDDRSSKFVGPGQTYPGAVPFCTTCARKYSGVSWDKPIMCAIGNTIYSRWEKEFLESDA